MKNRNSLNFSKNNKCNKSRHSFWMEIIFACVFSVLAMFLFIAAPCLIGDVILEPEEIPPIFFPRFILLIIFILSVTVILRAIHERNNITVDLNWLGAQRMIIMFISMIVYIFLFKRLGFIVSTSLLIFFLSWYYGNRNWIKLLALTIIFPPLIYFLFSRVFYILLPRGIL